MTFVKTIWLLLLFPIQLLAQDITGVWTGHIISLESRLPYEVVISADGRNYNGYALTIFTINGVENVGVKTIRLKQKKDGLSFEDIELIFDNYSTKPERYKILASLTLEARGKQLMLTGNFTTRSLDHRNTTVSRFSGFIELLKQEEGKATKLTAKLDELNILSGLSFMKKETAKKEPPVVATHPVKQVEEKKPVPAAAPPAEKILPPPPPPAADLEKRTTEVIRTMDIFSDSIVLTLYDNGTVDGDTVSVVLNGQVVLPRKGLTANAIRLTVPVTPSMGDSLMLVMFAENLGSIPPNTGLLIIQDGERREEVRFAGDMQKSSAVVLRRRKQ